MNTIHIIAGARPNFVKIAPIYHALKNEGWALPLIVHTGQHYDSNMSNVFFNDLEMPTHIYLGAHKGSHAKQTGDIMLAYEQVIAKSIPALVVVVGDVNSTMACAIVAKKKGIKVAHVEAGLRSNDMSMPEEINRIITDSIADILFTTEKSGVDNLKREGRKNIFFVGNVMIDTLFRQLGKLNGYKTENKFAVATLHRPSNVDDKNTFKGILEALSDISKDIKIVFPIHPRTKKNIEKWRLKVADTVIFEPPKSYVEFLKLWKDASFVMTDSGGLQEETTALKIPCFTIRNNTERPVTIEQGSNTLVGTEKNGILEAYEDFKRVGKKDSVIPDLWDGKTADRIVQIIKGLI